MNRRTTAARSALLRGQFDLTWSLFAYHLDRLVPEDFLWEPAALCAADPAVSSTSRSGR